MDIVLLEVVDDKVAWCWAVGGLEGIVRVEPKDHTHSVQAQWAFQSAPKASDGTNFPSRCMLVSEVGALRSTAEVVAPLIESTVLPPLELF